MLKRSSFAWVMGFDISAGTGRGASSSMESMLLSSVSSFVEAEIPNVSIGAGSGETDALGSSRAGGLGAVGGEGAEGTATVAGPV